MFWGSRSGHNLRQALYHLHSLPGADHWLQTRGPILVRVNSDLASFEAALQEGRYKQAIEIWEAAKPPNHGREALLWGFDLVNVPAFSDWLEVERARLEMLYLEALEHHILDLEKIGATSEALRFTQVLLREDPLNEGAYQIVMRLCYAMGQPEEARLYFEQCRRVLHEELGVEPSSQTLLLANASSPKHEHLESMTLYQALTHLPDPRSRQSHRFPLVPLMGLVMLALLTGAHSLRDIVRFGLNHLELLKNLGFHHLTPPGRSTLSELLRHLDPSKLRQSLVRVIPFSHLRGPKDPETLELLKSWAQEFRFRSDLDETARPTEILEQLGWLEVSRVGGLSLMYTPKTSAENAATYEPDSLAST